MRWSSLALVLVACASSSTRELKTANGSFFEVKCKGTPADCLARASDACPNGYETLDSESHAGGAAADALPGPVTWYSMTLKCGASTGEKPRFEHRGAAYEAPKLDIHPAAESKSRKGAECSFDTDCGPLMFCAKGRVATTGVCAEK